MISEIKINWKWILIGAAFIFIYGDQYLDNQQKEEIIDEVVKRHEEDKKKLDEEIERVGDSLTVLKNKDIVLQKKYDSIQSSIKRIRDERRDTQDAIPTYSDRKLDSILSNYRHR